MSKNQDDYDAIVIGSGIGGLTAASILAQVANKRVLVLEQHYVLGGLTHVFRRPGGYEWDVGIHYVGEMNPGDEPRNVCDFISKSGIAWEKMQDPFETFVFPDMRFEVPSDWQEYRQKLCDRFPEEADAVHQYFVDLRQVSDWVKAKLMAGALPGFLAAPFRLLNRKGRDLGLMTTSDYFNGLFTSPELKAILGSQWGDIGLPPSQSAFAAHALVIVHYLEGGFYPVGGSGSIADAIVPVIEAAGGKCLVNNKVTRIIQEGNKAVGVEVDSHLRGQKGTFTYRAPVILSNVGALITADLVGDAFDGVKADAEKVVNYVSSASLYLGLKESPAKLGLSGGNFWIYRNLDHDENAKGAGMQDGKVPFAYLTCASLKDPKADVHVAEIISVAAHEDFSGWSAERWKKRGNEYESLKDAIGAGLLELVEETLPGFSDLVDYQEVSTPLSVQHFTNAKNGAIYGLGCRPERFANTSIGVRTPVRNLYLTGSDGFFFGMYGAMMGGMAAAGASLGLTGLPKVIKAIKKYAEQQTGSLSSSDMLRELK